MRAGWRITKIKEVAQVINGGTPKTKVTEYWGGEHLWITPAEMGNRGTPYLAESRRALTDAGLKACSASLIPSYSVILSTRAPIGHLIINETPMAFNQGCRGIVPGDELLYKFLYYVLLFNVDRLNDLGSGTTFKELPAGKLRQFSIPIPPLGEQKRIVAILDEAFAGIKTAIANTEKNLANAREMFESYMVNLFSQKEEEWHKDTLDKIVDKKCSLSYGIVQPGKEFPNGLPIVRPTDLTQKVIKLDGLKRINPDLAKSYTRTTLVGNDLLLCVRGSTGTVSVASHELNGANVTRGIVPIQFDSSIITQEWGYFLLRSPSVQKQIKNKTYGTALMQINIRDMRKLELSIPPLDEQADLVNVLVDLSVETQKLESIYQQKLTALAELKQSLLQKAFSGELTAEKPAPDDTLKEEEIT